MWKIESVAVLILLVILAGIDIKQRKLPVGLLTVLTVSALLYRLLYREYGIWQYACGLVPGVMFLGISFMTRQALGYGDSWMILILGLYLGITDVVLLLMTAFLLAAVFSMACLTGEYISRGRNGGKHKRKREFAFIPVLALSYLGVILL